MSVAEDRQTNGWPRGFGSVKRAQELSRQLQPVLRDAVTTLATLERGFQGRYRIAAGEKPDADDLVDFIEAALVGTEDQEVEVIVLARNSIARSAGREETGNVSESQSDV